MQFNTLNNPVRPTKSSVVLLIEDNPDDIELTKRAFATTDLKITLNVAQDGQEALDYVFAKGSHNQRNINDLPKLILLDINLPKLSGLEVLKQIRNNPVTKFIPVVLLTTSDEFCDIAEGYQLGSNSYIKKPVSFKIFSEVIHNLGEYWLHINTPPPLQKT
ncbi:MAG: response regulator [Gammaproteobacteria bacterium]|nr:response regulator [Gammaproteobacteria bacterium]